MSSGPVLTLPTQALPDAPAPKNTPGHSNVRPKQTPAPAHDLKLLFSPPATRTANPSTSLQSTIDCDHDTISVVLQSTEAEEEYTLSAYGDISLSEVIVPSLPAPTHPSPSPLQQGRPQPRLRLKVRRPPMPKRRLSYTYIPDPLPRTGSLDVDERWPCSPRLFLDSPPWVQYQPLVSPLPIDSPTSWAQGAKPAKNGGSSLENFFDELIPSPPSIRLSPPGSPASQALSLPEETHQQMCGVCQGRDNVAKLPQSSPTPAVRQDKPKEALWRTRLPPRLPIPKWNM